MVKIVLITEPTSKKSELASSDGSGDGIFVSEMETQHQGINFGYYNRIAQPIAPVSYAVAGTNYDLWHIAATKDGSSRIFAFGKGIFFLISE